MLLLLLLSFVGAWAGSADSWAMLRLGSEALGQPRCVPIPANLSLCRNIDYAQMRLPNFLNHESLDEVLQQASSWLPLLRLNCHPDTQLFLCSLFAPVCLEKEIRPCRSLCEAVKGGCEGRMRLYGFAWPEMLACDQFPLQHDMCIKPRSSYIQERNRTCKACSQVATYENILDHFCRAEIVGKVKVASLEANRLETRRGRLLKPRGASAAVLNRQSIFYADGGASCPCEISGAQRSKRFLVAANRNARGELVATLILPWEKNRQFKKAVRMFQKLNCRTLGTAIRERARRERTRAYRASTTTQSRTTRRYDRL